MACILLLEDQKLFADTLSAHLSRCAESYDVHVAGNGKAAIRLIEEHQPDIILIQASLSEEYAFDVAQKIREIVPQIKMIFLSRQTFDSDVAEALNLGAKGFLLESEGLATLFKAIAAVLEGETFFSEPIRMRLVHEDGELKMCSPLGRPALSSLTPRERELLTYLGLGASLKEAAEAMSVSYKTADNQKASLMRKLDIHDRVELARFAIRQGLVNPHSSPTKSACELMIHSNSAWVNRATYNKPNM